MKVIVTRNLTKLFSISEKDKYEVKSYDGISKIEERENMVELYKSVNGEYQLEAVIERDDDTWLDVRAFKRKEKRKNESM